jgi:hypothetical protein
MLYRLFAALIVAFWMVMTVLLIRNEVDPEDSRVREVPVAHVMKILFLHQQRSSLRIYNGGLPIGHFMFEPKMDKESGVRTLDFTGTMQMSTEAQPRQRVSWDGLFWMNETFEIQKSELRFTVDPSILQIEIKTGAATQAAHLTIRQGGRTVNEMDLSLNEAGLGSLASRYGADAQVSALLQQAPAARATPVVRARLSSLRLRGERTETYLVTVEHGGQVALEAHFSQLGHLLSAKTLLGHTLLPDDYIP